MRTKVNINKGVEKSRLGEVGLTMKEIRGLRKKEVIHVQKSWGFGRFVQ